MVLRRCRLGRDRAVIVEIEAALIKLNARVLDTEAPPGVVDTDRCEQDDAHYARERRRIAKRTREALAVKRARGEKLGGPPPFGYRVVEALAVGGTVKMLAPHVTEQLTLKRIQALRAAGATHKAIAAELDRGSYPCRGTRWHATTVARILQTVAAAA